MSLIQSVRLVLLDYGNPLLKGFCEHVNYLKDTKDDENYSYAYLCGAVKNGSVPGNVFAKILMKQNTPASLNWLGYCYLNGCGVVQDNKMAFNLFNLSMQQDNVIAYLNVGFCYQHGIHVPMCLNTAYVYYTKCVERKYAPAMVYLGNLYLQPEFSLDTQMALKYYNESFNLGNLSAKFNIAKCYQYGYGTAKNVCTATRLFRECGSLENVQRCEKILMKEYCVHIPHRLYRYAYSLFKKYLHVYAPLVRKLIHNYYMRILIPLVGYKASRIVIKSYLK